MGRVQQNPVKNRISDVQSDQKINDAKSLQCQKLRSKSKPSSKTLHEKCSQPANNLKKTFALEHVLNNPSPNKERIVLGDKTNKSPTSPGNHNHKLKNPPLEQQKTSHPLSFSNEDSLSPYTLKLATSKNISSGKKHLLAMKSFKGFVEKHTKSSDNTDKCVYAKVQRETLRNRNMPFEEKMAQYEFEVDENEPVVRQKKKKSVKRKKKVTPASDEEYFPSQRNCKRIMYSGVEEAAKKAKEKAKDDLVESDLKCTSETTKDDICNESNNKIQMAVSSPSFSPSVRKCSNVLVENMSPVARPKRQNSLAGRNVRGLKDITELNASVSENSSMCNLKIFEKSRLSCSKQNARLEHATLGKVLESRPNESGNLSSSGRLQLAPDVNEANISTPIINNNYSRLFPFSEITSSTPVFSPLSRNNKTVETVPNSSIDCSVTQPHLNRRVFFVPRVSGSGVGNKGLVENWSVENCFGFEDSEEAELSPLTDVSLKKRLRKTTPTTSTPLVSNRRTPDHLRMKCKLATTVSHSESRKLRDEGENIAGSSKIDKSECSGTPKHEKSGKKFNSPNREKLLSVTTVHSPFSNPLKQSKLDLTSNAKIPISEMPKHNDQEQNSPLLFKDPGDKTPTHFKEPARRSYVRSVRRKMRPVGDEWIEIDSESEEEQENEHKISYKKTKKGKLSKQQEKQANKWMKDFNHQCAEIEDFELCVE